MLFSVRKAYAQRIKDLKESHDARVHELYKLVDVLVEQVEYLRLQLGKPQPVVRRESAFARPEAPVEAGVTSRMSEEEEDLQAMFENDLIDSPTLKSGLAALQGVPVAD